MEDILPGKTRWETEQYRKDCGKHAAQAQAFMRLALLMEYDEDFPAPLGMTHRIIDSKSFDVLWGAAALPSAGDETGEAAVDRFAAMLRKEYWTLPELRRQHREYSATIKGAACATIKVG